MFVVVKATSGPRDAMHSYVSAVKARDYPAAYDLLCSSTRDDVSASDFQDSVEAGVASGKDVTDVDITRTNVQNGSDATVGGTETLGDGTKDAFTATLRKEGGSWKICEFTSD